MQIFIWFLIKVSWLYTVVWVISVLENWKEQKKKQSKQLGGALQKYTDADFVQP